MRNGRCAPSSVFAFTPELDALFERGFPHLFVLSDTGPSKADEKLAREALEAVDPVLPVFVSRSASSRFLRGYAVGRVERIGATGQPIVDEARLAARNAALAIDAPVDLALLHAILDLTCPNGTDETYGWRVQQAIYLFEAFLGPEPVAEAIVERLVGATLSLEPWHGYYKPPNRQNSHACAIAIALGFLRLRLPAPRWKTLTAPLRTAAHPELIGYSKLLAAVADDRAAPLDGPWVLDLAMQRRDPAPIHGYLDQHGEYWWSPQAFYVAGADRLAGAKLKTLPRLDRWMQRRIVDHYGAIRHPQTVRVIMWILSGRSGAKAASEWLLAHADYAGPVLDDLVRAGDEVALARAALAVLASGKTKRAPALSEAKADAELVKLFGGLEKKLVAAKGKVERERAVLEKTFAKYCEIRSASGDVTPEAYFTHNLPKFSVDRELWSPWVDLAVEVARKAAGH